MHDHLTDMQDPPRPHSATVRDPLDAVLTASSILATLAILALAPSFDGPGPAALLLLLALALAILELAAFLGSRLVRLDPGDPQARAQRRRRAWLGRFVGANALLWTPAMLIAASDLDTAWPLLTIPTLLAASLVLRLGRPARTEWVPPAIATALLVGIAAIGLATTFDIEGWSSSHGAAMAVTLVNLGAHVLVLWLRRGSDDHPAPSP